MNRGARKRADPDLELSLEGGMVREDRRRIVGLFEIMGKNTKNTE
jgi:hypothetical protein